MSVELVAQDQRKQRVRDQVASDILEEIGKSIPVPVEESWSAEAVAA